LVILNVQRQLAGQNQELCQRAEADGRANGERDSQLVDLWEAIDKVAKKQQREREKVSGLQEAMGKVRPEIEGPSIQSGETEEAVERQVRTCGDEGS
jgi:peptidoglycan hydrolase CwlO-like protein